MDSATLAEAMDGRASENKNINFSLILSQQISVLNYQPCGFRYTRVSKEPFLIVYRIKRHSMLPLKT